MLLPCVVGLSTVGILPNLILKLEKMTIHVRKSCIFLCRMNCKTAFLYLSKLKILYIKHFYIGCDEPQRTCIYYFNLRICEASFPKQHNLLCCVVSVIIENSLGVHLYQDNLLLIYGSQ